MALKDGTTSKNMLSRGLLLLLLLLPLDKNTATQPGRTGKHHGPEGRTKAENPTQKLSNGTSETLETKQKTCKK